MTQPRGASRGPTRGLRWLAAIRRYANKKREKHKQHKDVTKISRIASRPIQPTQHKSPVIQVTTTGTSLSDVPPLLILQTHAAPVVVPLLPPAPPPTFVQAALGANGVPLQFGGAEEL